MLNPRQGVIATAGVTAVERSPKSRTFRLSLTIKINTRGGPLIFNGPESDTRKRAKTARFNQPHGG